MHSYKNESITITFDLEKCIHSAVCLKTLPQVFSLQGRPWINVDGGSVEEICKTIDACPSGALQYKLPDENPDETTAKVLRITVLEKGPYSIASDVEIEKPDGSVERCSGGCALCRCGKSHKKPFCDGSHVNSDL